MKENYLTDLIQIKYKHINLNNDLKYLTVYLVKTYLNELNDEYTIGLVYYSVFMCEKLIEKIYEFIKRSVPNFNLIDLIQFVKEKEYNQDLISIENQLVASVIDFFSIELIKNIDYANNSLEDTFKIISNFWMEIFTIRVNFGLFVDSYWAILFLYEATKTLSISKDNLKNISNIMRENIYNNNGFLKDYDLVLEINQLIQGDNTRDQISRLKVYFYGLCLDNRNLNDRKLVEIIFNELEQNPELIRFAVDNSCSDGPL
jgi:hypothetical protein